MNNVNKVYEPRNVNKTDSSFYSVGKNSRRTLTTRHFIHETLL